MKHWDTYENGGVFDFFDFDKKMVLINLDMIYEYSIKLDKLVGEDTELEEWVKMKLTRIEQNVSDVKHSLEGWEKFNEGGMIFKKQLLTISKYAKSLIDMIQGGSKLMSWQENKLAVCANDIDGIYHHLDYKMGNRAKSFELGGNIGIGSEIVFFDKYYDKKRTGTIISEVGRNEYEVGTSIGTKLVNKDEIIGLSEKVEDDSWFSSGGVTRYPDLSKEQPMVIKDSSIVGNFSEIDIKLVRKNIDLKNKIIRESRDAFNIFMQLWDKDKISVQEQLNVIFVSSANEVIGYYQHTTGGVDSTIGDSELIASLAIKTLSKGVIIAHNHPSGRLFPSDSDKKLYQDLKKALDLFRIRLLDSLIVAPNSNDYYSFADDGYEMGGEIVDKNNIEKVDSERNKFIEFSYPSKIKNVDTYLKVFFQYKSLKPIYDYETNYIDDRNNTYIGYKYETNFLSDDNIELTPEQIIELKEEAKVVFDEYFDERDYDYLFDEFYNFKSGGKVDDDMWGDYSNYAIIESNKAKSGTTQNKGFKDAVGYYAKKDLGKRVIIVKGSLLWINARVKGVELQNGEKIYYGAYEHEFFTEKQLDYLRNQMMIENGHNFESGGGIGGKEIWFSRSGDRFSIEKEGTARKIIETRIAKMFGATSMRLVEQDRESFTYELDGSPMLIEVTTSELKKQGFDIEDYGRKKRVNVPKSVIIETITQVRFPLITPYSNGGRIGEEIWQIRNSDGKYWSKSMSGKDVWNDSPDLGYTNTYEIAKLYVSNLEKLGYSNLEVVEYDKDWWKKLERGGETNYDPRWSEMEAYSPYESRKDYLAKEDLSDLTFASKKFSKSAEVLVRENLQNGEICMCKLRKILGQEPNYPTQIVGSLKLTKCFLRNYYKI